MAKNNSIFKIEGTLDNVTFYKTKEGHFVRTKGGVSKNKILKDPAFARTRENMSEFAHVARTTKSFRNALGGMVNRAKDARVSNRLSSLFAKIKKYDNSSDRGQRKIAIGIDATEAKMLLADFDFNKRAQLWQVLHKDLTVDETNGAVSIVDFIPLEHLSVPDGATDVVMTSAMMKYDFVSGQSELSTSPSVQIAIDRVTYQVSLTPQSTPSLSGITFFFIMIEFYQTMNGKMYAMKNGAFNVLHLIKVI